jgi:hypothetical protein
LFPAGHDEPNGYPKKVNSQQILSPPPHVCECSGCGDVGIDVLVFVQEVTLGFAEPAAQCLGERRVRRKLRVVCQHFGGQLTRIGNQVAIAGRSQ